MSKKKILSFAKIFFKILFLSIFLIIFATALTGYFSYPHLKKIAYKFLLKKLEIQKVRVEGIRVSKKNIFIKEFELIKSANLKIHFNELGVSFDRYNNFFNGIYELNGFSIKSLNVSYRDLTRTIKDTEPINIDSLLKSLAAPFKIKCDKIHISDFNINYENINQSFVMRNSEITGRITADSGIIKSEISIVSNNQTEYKVSGITAKLLSPDIKINAVKSDELYGVRLAANSIVEYTDLNSSIKIPQTPISINSGVQIKILEKKILSGLVLSFGETVKSDIYFDASYDSAITDLKLSFAGNKINLSGLAAYSAFKPEEYGLSKKLKLEIINKDTTVISYNFIDKKLGVKNLNLVFDIDNFNFKKKDMEIHGLKTAGFIKGDFDFDNDFNLSPDFELSMKTVFSADFIKHTNCIISKKIFFKTEFSKSKKLDIKSVSDSLQKKTLYSLDYLNNLLSVIGDFSFSFASKQFTVFSIYKFSDVALNLTGASATPNFSLKTKWESFNTDFLTGTMEIPEGSANINLSLKNFQIFDLSLKLKTGKIFKTFLTGHFEFPDNWIEVSASGSLSKLLEIYKKSFIRTDIKNLSGSLSEFGKLIPAANEFNINGDIFSNIYIIKEPDKAPVFSGKIKMAGCSASNTQYKFSFEGLNADLELENYVFDFLPVKSSFSEIETPAQLEKTRNFYFSKIRYDNYLFADISGYFSFYKNIINFNNVSSNFLDGTCLLNAIYDLSGKNLIFKSKINNADLNKAFFGNDYTGKKIPVSAGFDLSFKNAFSDTKLFDINNVEASLNISPINKETILSILNFTDPQNSDPNTPKLKFALKYAEPVFAKASLYSGMLNFNIGFNSKLIKEFRIDRIQINKLKLFKF